MGQTHASHLDHATTTRNSDIISRTSNILNEKEYMLAAIRADIEESLSTKNAETLKTLEAEIRKHIVELSTLQKQHLQMPRLDKLLYHYELCLAKVRSFLKYDVEEKGKPLEGKIPSVTEEDFEQMFQEFSEVNQPFLRQSQTEASKDEGGSRSNDENFASTTQMTNQSANSVAQAPGTCSSNEPVDLTNSSNEELDVTRNVYKDSIPLRKQQLKSGLDQNTTITEEDIQRELDNLSLERSTSKTESINFIPGDLYPATQTNYNPNSEESRLSSEELFNDQTINELEIMYDSCCTEKDYKELEDKVFAFVNLIHTSTSKNRSIWVKQTVELLEKIKATRRGLYRKDSKSSNSEVKGDDYLTLWESQSAMPSKQDVQSHSDAIDNSSIYSNFEVIKNHISLSSVNNEESLNVAAESMDISNSDTHLDRPETIYGNVEVIREHINTLEQRSQSNLRNLENPIHKPPVPNPRRHEDKLMKDLALYWEKICDIEENGTVSLEDIRQVEDMQKYLEVAQDIFKRKIESIHKKYEEMNCDTVDV